MNMKKQLLIAILSLIIGNFAAQGQARFFNSARVKAEEAPKPEVSVSDSLLAVYGLDNNDPFSQPLTLPDVFFMPPIYDSFTFSDEPTINDETHTGDAAYRWIEDYNALSRQMKSMRRNLYFNHPELVQYNQWMLPEAPQQYVAVINPSDFSISVVPSVTGPVDTKTITAEAIKKRHWIQTFNASLQFSQAYVSPNWYQGGNNNLNALANIYYNVKLNQEYHKNLLFELTAQYKLGTNNAPDDSIHSYNISEDIFQVNTTFGVKAAHRWYYSFTGQFKTQLLNSYKSNSNDLKSSFMSPGELTVGLGMTYNYANTPKTFTFDASIAPLSYNLTTCLTNRIDHSTYSIEVDKKTASNMGSSAELKLAWKISHNISLASRLFAFSDYESFQADWENTLSFEINKFLTTQIYAHARYDSRTPRDEDSSWHKLQLKEIFSIGFAYKFSSI